MDLSVQPPRGGDQELGGWSWLPRMVDKARATYQGNPAAYKHPCSRDHMLLAELGLTVEDFRGVIESTTTDEQVLEAVLAMRQEKGLA
ncbi:MAG: DUF5069 domain-containing protein [Thermoleophilia bacterium]|nr:DUF5069 domain-containing protein [Thermoleophilia bacterium]